MSNSQYYGEIFHEIKNSVTLINSYLQLIEKKHPEITSLDYWETSKNETSRLRGIVAELSQIKFGKDLKRETIDIREFLSDCCNAIRFTSGDENISCTLSMPEQPLLVPADTKQLRHAIINILKNSCEAMHHSGEILVDASPKARRITIHITDFGCGISPNILPYIFDPFITTKEDGSGLGLNITKQIIAAHKGTIAVNSTEGKGTTFTLTLPMARTLSY